MNVLDRIKNLSRGAEHIINWLGEGGEIVSPDVAQHRANICLGCEFNQKDGVITPAVAAAVRKTLGAKNKMNLRVNGEKSLYSCSACNCVIRLLVWERQEKIEPYLTEEDRSKLPSHCWKLDKS